MIYLPFTALSAAEHTATATATAVPTVAPPPLAPAAPTATATGPAAEPPARTPPLRVPVGAAVPLYPLKAQPIATLWPGLPDSFKQGVRGAADVDGVLYLFRGGRCVRADGAAPALTLSEIPGWPQTPTWRDGVIDHVGSASSSSQVLLVRGAECLVLDLAAPAGRIAIGPRPLSAAFGGAFQEALQGKGGAPDAVLFGATLSDLTQPRVFQGPAVSGFDTAAGGGTLQWQDYVARHFAPVWPAPWNPLLAQAPSGRTGDLWAATTTGVILHHDGTEWTQTAGAAHSVAAGADGSAYCIGISAAQAWLFRWDPGSSNWDAVAQHSQPLSQVAVGDGTRVWLRDEGNAVLQMQQGQGGQGPQLAQVPQLGTAVHVAASADGTVWSCDGSRPSAFRYISEAGAPPDAIATAGPVQRVAGTGFGAVYVLAESGQEAQLYRYRSPYVFMTPQSYFPSRSDPIELALGNLYFSIEVGVPDTRGQGFPTDHYVVALDAHTGQEVSRSAPAPRGTRYTMPVFDPLHEVIVVGLVRENPTAPASQMLGLDARDLTQVRWAFSPQGPNGAPIDVGGRPALQGTRLCFTDNGATIAMYDTGAAPGATPAHRWSYSLPTIPVGQYRLPPPVLSGGTVYATWWTYDTALDQQQLGFVALDATTGAAAGTGPAWEWIDAATIRPHYVGFQFLGDNPPLLAQVVDGGQARSVLFVNGGNVVWRIDVATPNPALSYTLDDPNDQVQSGFAWGAGGLWFGDGVGKLHGLSERLVELPHSPAQLDTTGARIAQIRTTPVIYETSPLAPLRGTPGAQAAQAAQGQAASAGTAIFVGVYGSNRPPSLVAFDPSGGNVFATDTGVTWLTTLSPAVADGVLYAAGSFSGGAESDVTQAFGIRVDEVVQGLRDFVAESELLQDFDPPPPGQSQPASSSGAARYQTHLTVLDDAGAPRSGTAVKIWADAPTAVQVNGTPFAIGPGDAEFATATSGPDGVVTIVSGAVSNPGQGPGQGPAPISAAADMAAVSLRVWAPFMNPYERLLIFPDREFHNRLATAHATTDQSDKAYADPTRINLQTARSFGPVQPGGAPSGPPLFTDGDKQQQQPQQVASAIQAMTGATGGAPAPVTAAATAGRRTLRAPAGGGAAWVRRVTDTPGRYLAYDDLPGARYGPTNAPALQPAVVVQPAGLSFAAATDSATPTFSTLTPAAAAAAIDGLQDTPWALSAEAPAHIREAARRGAVGSAGAGLGSWWSDFWAWLKQKVEDALARVTHFIVSVAEDIYVGIRVIVGGLAYVFKQVVQTLAEVAHAIGAFFVALAKAIAKVVQALALLFDFGEVIKTHNIIKTELLARINGVPGNPAYPGFSGVIKNTVLPKVDGFFGEAEQGITDTLNGLAGKISGTAPVGGFAGGGSTAHTAFTVKPKAGGTPSSQAVQGTWGLQKLKAGAGTASAPGARAGRGAGADPLAAVFDGFATKTEGSGVLAGQWNKVREGFPALGAGTSAGDFLRRGLAELLQTLALIMDAVLVLANDFVDGLLNAIDALLSTLLDARTGLLNAPLEIPVLSWLYQQLFGEPLTVLNVVALVVALPVTLIWRIVEGQWPSQSAGPAIVGPATAAGRVGVIPPILQGLLDYANAFLTLTLGFLNAVGDVLEDEDEAGTTVSGLALAASLFSSACAVPLAANANPSDFDWIAWGVALGAGSLNVLGLIQLEHKIAALELKIFGSFLLSVCSAALFWTYIMRFVKAPPPNPLQDAALGLSIATTIPGTFNFLKLAGPPLSGIIAILDVVMGVVGMVVIFIEDSASGP